jgi:DNA-binding response OmpR family regulator
MEPVFYLENDENDFLLMDLAFRKVASRNFVRWFRRSAELKTALLKSSPDQLPKLLLVDLRLDGEYGLDVIEWLGMQDERLKGIPAFIISSGQIGHEIVSTLERCAVGYVFKPSSLEGWLELARQFRTIAEEPTTDLAGAAIANVSALNRDRGFAALRLQSGGENFVT